MKFLIILIIIFSSLVFYRPTVKSVNSMRINETKFYSIEKVNSLVIEIKEIEDFRECKATWYGNEFDGRLTANGDVFNQWGLSAASLDYAIGTDLLVCTPKACVTLKVNDKGHLKDCLDLSRGAFNRLGDELQGVLNVRVKVI